MIQQVVPARDGEQRGDFQILEKSHTWWAKISVISGVSHNSHKVGFVKKPSYDSPIF